MNKIQNIENASEILLKSFKTSLVEKPIDLYYDLRSLVALDINGINYKLQANNHPETEEYLKNLSRDNAQLLMNQLFDLPRSNTEDGIFAQLPNIDHSLLPRAKPIPKPKAPTRWEKFAKEKGINKKKKSRKEYDEASGEYKPTYGYGSKNVEKDWIIEVPKNEDPMIDQYEKLNQEKKERVDKNKKRQKRNEEERIGGESAKSIRDSKKQQIELNLRDTRASTASLGRFDKKLKNEDKIKLKRLEKRKFQGNTDNVIQEKQVNLNAIEKVLKGGPQLNVNKAVKNMQETKRMQKRSRK